MRGRAKQGLCTEESLCLDGKMRYGGMRLFRWTDGCVTERRKRDEFDGGINIGEISLFC